MTQLTHSVLVLTTIGLVSACASGTDNDATPSPEVFVVPEGAVQSNLAGRALAGTQIRSINGVLIHTSGAILNLTDGLRSISDADGPVSEVWTDGISTLQPLTGQTERYGSVGLFQFDSPAGSGPVVVGIPTQASDITEMGTVSFTGTAFVEGISSAGALTTTGTSTLAVDFGSGDVDLTINAVSGVPYETLLVTDMAAAGDRTSFEGGTLTLSQDGTDVTTNLLGADASGTAAGDFFGIGTPGQPDEAGGLFQSSGTNGALFGGFIAD